MNITSGNQSLQDSNTNDDSIKAEKPKNVPHKKEKAINEDSHSKNAEQKAVNETKAALCKAKRVRRGSGRNEYESVARRVKNEGDQKWSMRRHESCPYCKCSISVKNDVGLIRHFTSCSYFYNAK